MKIAFIIPTKDRPNDLRKMLESLAGQTKKPDQVIVVDSSTEPVEVICRQVNGIHVDYIRWLREPSAAVQRNGGLVKLHQDIDLVCFFDDDQVLYPDAIEKMMVFWQAASDEVGGTSFNMANFDDKRPARMKKSRLADALGLYRREPGKVARSGWQSLYGKVDRNTRVEWLSSQAVVVRREILAKFQFDPFFKGYSYLEDLDFSYSVSRLYTLVVVADALFNHYPRYAERTDNYRFGLLEVRNRLYFVKKHKLSAWRCYLCLVIRWCMTVTTALVQWDGNAFQRSLGNIAGLLQISCEKAAAR